MTDRQSRRLLLGLMALAAALFAWLSIARYRGYNTAMEDIGNMAQAMWSGTRGRPLLFTYFCHPVSRLGLHAELIYLLFVPLYAIAPSPMTLLVVQAVLFAAGAWPLYRLARRHLASETAALAVVLIYLLYPLADNAVLFDFHADTIAMPLFFFALEALDRGEARRYAFWIALALASKVYVAYAVALLGGLLFVQGKRRVGLGTIAAAFAWGATAFFLVKPWFASRYGLPVQSYDSYAGYYFGKTLATLGATWAERLLMGLLVLLPLLPAAKAAPWHFLTVALSIAPVLLSSSPGPSYSYKYHHYALTIPFIVMTILAAAETMRRRGEQLAAFPAWRVFLLTMLIITVGLNIELSDTPLSPAFWRAEYGHGLDPWKYGRTSRDEVKDAFLRPIPDDAALFATNFLAPHLVNRATLCTMIPAAPPPPPDYEERLLAVDEAVFDALFDYNVSTPVTGLVAIPATYLRRYLDQPEWQVVAADDGLVLLQREAPPDEVLPQSVTHTLATAPPVQRRLLGEGVSLVQAEIAPLGGRRFAWRTVWYAEEGEQARPPLFAVSHLQGVENGRILHLPTLALYPCEEWEAGSLITETFTVVIPDRIPAGRYEVAVGLYRLDDPFAYATDERSRLGDLVPIGSIEVP